MLQNATLLTPVTPRIAQKRTGASENVWTNRGGKEDQTWPTVAQLVPGLTPSLLPGFTAES